MKTLPMRLSMLLLLPLAACVAFGQPAVHTIGPEIYAIRSTLPSTLQQAKTARTAIIKQAKAYCENLGRSVEINNEDVPNPTARTYQLTFQCPRPLNENNTFSLLTLPRPIAINPKPANNNLRNL